MAIAEGTNAAGVSDMFQYTPLPQRTYTRLLKILQGFSDLFPYHYRP